MTAGMVKIAAAAALVVAAAPSAPGQVLAPEVTLHLERLPLDEQQYLRDAPEILTRLISNRSWTEDGFNYSLPVKIDLFLEKYSVAGAYHRYGGGIMVATRSGLQLRDTRWEFRYSRDQSPNFGEPFDPLAGMVEFCLWVCLGFEGDLNRPLGGQTYYDRARTVAEAAQFESLYSLGWNLRRDLARRLSLDTAVVNVRRAAYHARVALWFTSRNNWESAVPSLNEAVAYLLRSTPDLMEMRVDDHIFRFVDRAKLAQALQDAALADQLNALAEWDPEHSDFWK